MQEILDVVATCNGCSTAIASCANERKHQGHLPGYLQATKEGKNKPLIVQSKGKR